MKFNSDIDIDFGNRDNILQHIKHVPAAMRKVIPIRKHSTGIYVTDIPYDAINEMSTLDYTVAEERGYIKLDFFNNYASDTTSKFFITTPSLYILCSIKLPSSSNHLYSPSSSPSL